MNIRGQLRDEWESEGGESGCIAHFGPNPRKPLNPKPLNP